MIMKDIGVKASGVGKKFSKDLTHMMLYGVQDIALNTLGMDAPAGILRKGEFWALDNVSFELKRGQTLGVIGPNGSGKTTLLKLLNGIFMPDRGKIEISGRVGALIQVGAGFHPMLTGRENIYVNGAILGMSKKEIDKKFDSIVDFADIGEFLDAPVRHYSSGMFVRLGFSVAIHCEPDILLVDEVLAVGDMGFQTKCFNEIGRIRKKGAVTVLVSHNMHIVSAFAEKVMLLTRGKYGFFDDVAEGVQEYNRLFTGKEYATEVEKVCSGNEKIKFFDVRSERQVFNPGDSFSISMRYESVQDYNNVDIDIAILSERETGHYFQATNKAYGRQLNLNKGSHKLEIAVEDIKINNARARIAIAIWSERREELLFWWWIPIEFRGVEHSSGKNFFNISYNMDQE